MNTQKFSSFQVFQSLSRKCRSHLLSCPKEFIRFLCECIVNLLKGNLQAIERHRVVKFQSLVTIAKKNNLEAKKKSSVVRKRIASNSSLYICLNMEQFVLVPASVYNKSVITQSVTKQELPKYKAEQAPTYQIDSLKRDIYKNLFGKADNLIDKILSRSRIKLSDSQTISLDGADTGVLISDFTLHLRRKNLDVPDIYFTLLDAAGITPSLVFNQNAKAKDRGSWVPFKV